MKSQWQVVLASLILTVNVVSIGAAQESTNDPLVTDRPDFTESPLVVPQGRVQVEGGYTYTRSGDDREHALGELLVRVPVSRKAELRFGVPSYLRQSTAGGRASGFDNAFLGAKFALSPGGGKKPATALLVGAVLPTGARFVRESGLQPEAIVAASWELCPTVALSINAGYARPSDGGVRFNQFLGSVSAGFTLSDKWGAYAEVFGMSKADASGKSAKYADGGVTYLINNDFQLDARAGIGLNNHAGGPDFFVGFGASRRF